LIGLKNKVAVVTGGAGGIGQGIARRLAADGVRVALADLQAEAGHEVVTEMRADGAEVEFFGVDLRQSREVDRMIKEVRDRFGRIDILINNAGVHLQKLVVELEDEEWDTILETNLRGCFFCTRAVAAAMMAQEHGRIVNIVTRLFPNPYSSAYIASKSAIWGFTQCVAMELAPYGITVNAVAPGVMLGTGMEKWFREKGKLSGMAWEEFRTFVEKGLPLGRWSRPEDVAGTIAFLCSDEAAYITGELVNVTGGWTGYAVPVRRKS